MDGRGGGGEVSFMSPRQTYTRVLYYSIYRIERGKLARPSLRELLSRSSITYNTIIDVHLNLRLRQGVGGVVGGGGGVIG